jgi:hypothetical protein
MSFTEILEELPKLSPEELNAVQRKLDELHESSFEETPEMLAAIDEGIRSLREEGSIPIEDVIREFKSWNTKSA